MRYDIGLYGLQRHASAPLRSPLTSHGSSLNGSILLHSRATWTLRIAVGASDYTHTVKLGWPSGAGREAQSWHRCWVAGGDLLRLPRLTCVREQAAPWARQSLYKVGWPQLHIIFIILYMPHTRSYLVCYRSCWFHFLAEIFSSLSLIVAFPQ